MQHGRRHGQREQTDSTAENICTGLLDPSPVCCSHRRTLRKRGTFRAVGWMMERAGSRKESQAVLVPRLLGTRTHPRGNRVQPGHSAVRLLRTTNIRDVTRYTHHMFPSTLRNTRLVCGYVSRSARTSVCYVTLTIRAWFFRLPFFLPYSIYVDVPRLCDDTLGNARVMTGETFSTPAFYQNDTPTKLDVANAPPVQFLRVF